MPTFHVARTDGLSPSTLRSIRLLLETAFRGRSSFTDDDWTHALGGTHVWLEDPDGCVISHGALVSRSLICAGHPLRTGYVEAVATAPEEQRRGHGATVMKHIGALIREQFVVGALSTSVPSFYEPFGWERWRGPTWVDGPAGRARTPDDDGGVMILRTPSTPDLDLNGQIVCDWRSGDVW